ncbi:MAG: sulfur oxidation c-type cytochrome SoxX [Betaproteobacteria bacterium]|nr:sulfur oxidation c-type cytochrome SoxX [Betaproteobacteria bacterium]
MNIRNISLLSSAAMIALLAAFPSQAQDYRAQAVAMMKRDFHAKGMAGMDRLNEDGLQAICNRTNNKPPKGIAEQMEKDEAASLKLPADGKLMGDWKSGEKIAQAGNGMTWSDKPGAPAGGSCYNCHQIGPKETSFGTIGPSLFHFGKTRGFSPENQKYAYTKIYDSKITNLCSSMPRFGHTGTLTEQQIKDLVALLMDPSSPVNQ